MERFRADLHCHTTCSDGTLSPENVIKKAKELGLKGLSITDHDNVDAYQTAFKHAEEQGIQLIPGVEFSAELNGESIHILAYAFDLKHPALDAFCQRHTLRREKRNLKILEKLAQHHMPITPADIHAAMLSISGQHTHGVGRPHIAMALLSKGYVASVQEAFNKYIGEGQCCFVDSGSFSVQETLSLIHEVGGLAVIAHPHLVHHSGVLQQLLNMNFDGIECYYARFGPEKHARWIKMAQKKNWLITGGSDFHGEFRLNNPLGCSWVDHGTFDKLQLHYLKQKQ